MNRQQYDELVLAIQNVAAEISRLEGIGNMELAKLVRGGLMEMLGRLPSAIPAA